MNTSRPLVIGTRGSELALCQADMVTAALRAAHPALRVERKIISTTGDRRQDLRFRDFVDNDVLDKGIFTKELELALEAGEIDAAVHSLKDVPTQLGDAFVIVAVLPRAPIEDVLVSREGFTLSSLPKGARVATSSVRRMRQLRWFCAGVECVEIRGNVPTRIRKLSPPSDLDGVLLARAGLERLGLLREDQVELDGAAYAAAVLPCETFLPAAGQGAIGIEIRSADTRCKELLDAINHEETFLRITAERHFLHLLRAGCQTPIGAHSWIAGGRLHMKVRVFDEAEEGAAPVEAEADAPVHDPRAVAAALAKRIQTP